MEDYIEIKDLNEAIWRNHYQLLVSDKTDTNCLDPICGSAFRLLYRDRIWIVTADHVIHPDIHGIDLRKRQGESHPYEYNYFILNNVNVREKLETILTSIFGFYYFDRIDALPEFSDQEIIEAGITIEDLFSRLDIAFCEQTKEFPYPMSTHSLQDSNGNVIVKEGLVKLAIPPEAIAEPTPKDTYYNYGVICNGCSNGVLFKRKNAMYCNLKYNGFEDFLYKFQYPYQIKLEEWESLSGSAFFNQEGKVVGMVIRVSPETNIVWVVPIKYILRFIDYSIYFEQDTKTQNE